MSDRQRGKVLLFLHEHVAINYCLQRLKLIVPKRFRPTEHQTGKIDTLAANGPAFKRIV